MIGVPSGTRLVLCVDKYRRWHLGVRTGTIVKRASMTCWVVWDDDPGEMDRLDEGDVRYWVDTDRARLAPPRRKSLLD